MASRSRRIPDRRLFVPIIATAAGLFAVLAVVLYLLAFNLDSRAKKGVEALISHDYDSLLASSGLKFADEGDFTALFPPPVEEPESEAKINVKLLENEKFSGDMLAELLRAGDPGKKKAHFRYDWGKIEMAAQVTARVDWQGSDGAVEKTVSFFMVSQGVKWYLAPKTPAMTQALAALLSFETLAEHDLGGVARCAGYDLKRACAEDAALLALAKTKFGADSYDALLKNYRERGLKDWKEAHGETIQAKAKLLEIVPIAFDAASYAQLAPYLRFPLNAATEFVKVTAAVELDGDKGETVEQKMQILMAAHGTEWFLIHDIPAELSQQIAGQDEGKNAQ